MSNTNPKPDLQDFDIIKRGKGRPKGSADKKQRVRRTKKQMNELKSISF